MPEYQKKKKAENETEAQAGEQGTVKTGKFGKLAFSPPQHFDVGFWRFN